VAREWSDLFITADAAGSAGAARATEPGSAAEEAMRAEDSAAQIDSSGEGRAAQRPARGGLIRRLRESLSKTRQALGGEIQATLFGPLDEQTWERLEEALIRADVGVSTTASVVASLESEASEGKLEGGEALSERLIGLLAETARIGDGRIDISSSPAVILVVGVNGTGKTTTIGKLAWHLQNELGRSVLMGAADTFRAAAREQLEGWAQRAGCEIVTGPEGSDPGAVAFEAVGQALSKGVEVVIVDTAGRLHIQEELMRELGKVRRVLARQLEDAPHETLLTLDATTGQNGLRQARLFGEFAGLTGIALTKLDGTARGGIALAIAHELELPVKLIGVGESVEDLRPFDPEDFARALISPG
jgi:fused signal recognition particle receptor